MVGKIAFKVGVLNRKLPQDSRGRIHRRGELRAGIFAGIGTRAASDKQATPHSPSGAAEAFVWHVVR